ncbi:MAG: hypothetical protein B5766_02390 [Candidatus Lumbricidophila eiseniae]|uniref:Uncharacterized protein n=1 Tax=Candidatus Lumbricidiphila eiseniae TaxID=1969409 RepID=A0A2A6FT18_9MICO|nr:MAG: hypothetical protein B5766_02390 [Candidatus Lumbricidophila eiseniae]
MSRHTFLLTIRNRDKLALTARLRCELLPCYVGDSDISASEWLPWRNDGIALPDEGDTHA